MVQTANNNSNEIQNLKSNIDIVTVADDLGCLPPKQGSIFQGGRCPTGHESQGGKCFTIYPDTQHAYCFHCGKSWDVIALVEDIKEFDFIPTCNWLSRQYNLPYLKTKDMTPEERTAYQSRLKEQKIIFDILTEAARYYHKSLMSDGDMKSHLTTHYGLTDETITGYALGYSTGSGLLKYLQKLDYSMDDIVKSGLFVKVGSKREEFFNNRLIFPYWKSGQVIYFIGRKTDRTSDKTCEQAKYKKLPTKNENRSYISEVIGNQWFYGEDSIRGAETVFVAEGVTDCLAMLQAGYSTISPVTVRFRAQDQEHLNKLTRRATTIYLVPDNETNEAGIKGALDTAGKLEEARRSVYIVKLPLPEEQEKIDVADILRDYGKEKLEELIKAAKTPLQIEIDQISAEGLDLIRLSDRLKPVKKKLALMPQDRITAYLEYAKKSLGVKTDFIKAIEKELKLLIKDKAQDTAGNDNNKARYSAVFQGLVEIVQTETGERAFLVLKDKSLEIVNFIENDGETYQPPLAETMRWLLPRGDEVVRYFKSDTDKALYFDLINYHKGISELPTENHYRLLAIWDLHAYLFEKSEYTPIIWFYATPERGKSRTGKGCTYIARRGLHVESLRDAYLIRVAENLKSTLFFDVIDLWRKAEKTGTEDILLLRYEKGATVPRVLYPDRGAHQDTVYFDVYGPTIIATNNPVSEIFATRAIQIVMPLTDKKFENDVLPEDGLELKERLTAFRARHLAEPLPNANKPCNGRLGDILKPLLQIVKLAIPNEENHFLEICKQIENDRYENLADTLEGKIIQAILELDQEIEQGKLEAKKIAEKINENVPEKFYRSQNSVTRKCKSMSFGCVRSGGITYIKIDKKTIEKLSVHTLGKSALSAHTEQHAENKEDIQCTFSDTLSAENNNCTDNKTKVYLGKASNSSTCAESAESAENPGVCDDKKTHINISDQHNKKTEVAVGFEEGII